MGLLLALLVGLDKLRYMLEIDKEPLSNSFYNALIGVVGGCGYGVFILLERRQRRRSAAKSREEN